jgi:hypothetical protein
VASKRRVYVGPDGIPWRVEMKNPGASNAQLIFQHPDATKTRENRYAHYLARGPESQNVTGMVDTRAALETLDDTALARLFRRSMVIAGHPTINGRRA